MSLTRRPTRFPGVSLALWGTIFAAGVLALLGYGNLGTVAGTALLLGGLLARQFWATSRYPESLVYGSVGFLLVGLASSAGPGWAPALGGGLLLMSAVATLVVQIAPARLAAIRA